MKKLIESINYKSLGVHLGVLLGFVLLSLSVFYPILQGKELLQSDIQQYRGMSRQLQESRERLMRNCIGSIMLLEECQPIN